MKGNTPDFIIEHFIVHFSSYSGRPPSEGMLSLTVMTIVTHTKHTARSVAKNTKELQTAKNPAKCTINKSYNHVSSYCYNCSTLLR